MSVSKHITSFVHRLLNLRAGLDKTRSWCEGEDEEDQGRDVQDDVEEISDS